MRIKILIALLFVSYFLNVANACTNCDKELIIAIKKGDSKKVTELIANGVNVNCIDESTGQTPLMFASYNGFQQIVETLISNGAQLNVKVLDDKVGAGNLEGFTAIGFAVIGGQEEVALYILDHGAEFEVQDTDGATLLMGAVRLNMKKLVFALLKKGADVNKQAKNGYTALTLAVQSGNTGMVKLLMKYGANCHIRILKGENKGLTAIDLAKSLKNDEILRLLLNKRKQSSAIKKHFPGVREK